MGQDEALAILRDNDVIGAALRLASRSLYERIVTADSGDGELGAKAIRGLLRYHTRMATRCTPFGLFAGVTFGRVSDRSECTLDGLDGARAQSRLDMGVLEAMCHERDRAVERNKARRFFTNDSVHWLGDRLQYYQTTLGDLGRERTLSTIGSGPDHRVYLEHMETPRPLSELIDVVSADGYDRHEASAYVDALVQAQLLVAVAGPVTIGPDIFLGGEEFDLSPSTRTIERLLDSARQLGRRRGAELCSALSSLEQAVEEALPDGKQEQVVQVDLFRKARKVILDWECAKRICESCREVWKLLGKKEAWLERFKEEFRERYGKDLVPLAEVLDAEIGIAASLLPPDGRNESDLSRLTSAARTRVLSCIAGREPEVRLTEVDFATTSNAGGDDACPNAWGAMVSFVATNGRGSPQLRLLGFSGPSGTELMGRFAYGLQELTQALRDHCAREAALYPNDVLAEVVHLPEGHMGNLIFRPRLRETEVVFLGRCEDLGRQLRLSDLMVTVRSDEVVLYSRTLESRIRPRLATAHNFQGLEQLPVYRFLGFVARQDGRVYGFDWGDLRDIRYLPRLVVGDAIIQPAQWFLDSDDIAEAVTATDFNEWIRSWRSRERLPQYVTVGPHSQQLAIDLDRDSDQMELRAQLKRSRMSGLHLYELLRSDTGFVQDTTGHAYCHEITIPFIRTRPLNVPSILEPHELPRRAQLREWHDDKTWLCLYLYTGRVLADRILRERIVPVVEVLTQSNLITKWFFIRYGDPHFHLRLRFAPTPNREQEVRSIVTKLVDRLTHDALVHDVFETAYRPEVFRYGGPEAIKVAENLFELDSAWAIASLNHYSSAPDDSTRRSATVAAADLILDAFSVPLGERLTLLDRALRGIERSTIKEWNNSYRQFNDEFRHLVPLRRPSPTLDDQFVESLLNWHAEFSSISHAYQDLALRGRLTRDLGPIALDFVHMHVNRCIGVDANLLEGKVAHWLRRRYRGMVESRALSERGVHSL